MRIPPPLAVDERDVHVLRGWISGGGPAAARRARIVLLAREGLGPSAIAEELRCSKQTVITWRERYRAGGLTALRDAPRSGRPTTVDAAEDADPTAATRFLKGLTSAGDPHRLGLLVDGSGEDLGPWVESPEVQRSGVVPHRAPPGVPWGHLVRVACLVAGASAAGVASVVALRDAVGRHPAGRSFAWTHAAATERQ